jgi:CheY-like chemotaxis protein
LSINDDFYFHLHDSWNSNIYTDFMTELTKEVFQIVVVDDEPDICEILTEFLRISGFSVTSFNSAAEAILHMKSNATHLIVSDVRMPNISGIEFLTIVRTEFGRHIPFIIMTGQSDVSREEAIDWGATAYFDKPVDFMELVKVITTQYEKIAERWKYRKRLSVQFKISGTCPRGAFTGIVENISDGGIFIASKDEPLWPGDEIEFTIEASNGNFKTQGRGVIKWTKDALEKVPQGAGLQFININDLDLGQLLKLAETPNP